MTGRIIFLNGGSSAGKTTLSKVLQDTLTDPWFHIALDQFRDAMPGRYRGMNAPKGTPGYLGMNVVPVRLGDDLVTEVRLGDLGQNMLKGMHQAIRGFVDAGNNVIIDDLIMQPETLQHYISVLAGYWVLFVAVKCSLKVALAREAIRPGRFPGTARSHYDIVHAHGHYDMEVNTDNMSAECCAAEIMDYLNQGLTPSAFNKLNQRENK